MRNLELQEIGSLDHSSVWLPVGQTTPMVLAPDTGQKTHDFIVATLEEQGPITDLSPSLTQLRTPKRCHDYQGVCSAPN